MLRIVRLSVFGVALTATLCATAGAQTTGSRINPASNSPLDIIRFDEPAELGRIRAELTAGNVEEAIAIARDLIASDSSASIQYAGYNALCACYSATKSWDDALVACDRAIRIFPGHWMARNTRGNIFLLQGKPELALADYQTALASLGKSDSRREVVEHNIALAQAQARTGS